MPVSSAAVDRVESALRRIREVDRPEVWISVADEGRLLGEAGEVDRRVAAGDRLPLAGTIVAVKDNIDAAGLDTTAGSPGAAYRPEVDAEAVRRLRAAGAVVLGKTNLDQFATGLVGTRSPYGAVRAAADPTLVSGGSSAGSAVAVALGIVDAALGTDTAGSGRVPAAFNGIVGVKPTLGLVSIRGVVPASPSYDAVTVFTRDVATAERFLAVLVHPDPQDPASRPWSTAAPLAAPPEPVLGVPDPDALAVMEPGWREAFERTVQEAESRGFTTVEVDISDLLAVARLLYEGGLVAERTASFGELLTRGPETVDPVVASIVGPGADVPATRLVEDQQQIRAQRARLPELWSRVDALLLPTAPGHPSIAEVRAEPVAKNAWVGTYTNFVNLLDLAAVAVPGSPPVGVSLIGPAHSDRVLLDLAARLAGEDPVGDPWLPDGVSLIVFGAHMSGQPLNHQLVSRGARLVGPVRTAPSYRLFALGTEPPKPGLVRVRSGGAPIEGEEWLVPPARLADVLDDLVPPMAIASVRLADGRDVLGFTCEPDALDGARDITALGGWRAHLVGVAGE